MKAKVKICLYIIAVSTVALNVYILVFTTNMDKGGGLKHNVNRDMGIKTTIGHLENNPYYQLAKEYCMQSGQSPSFEGQVFLDCHVPTWTELERKYTNLKPGGWYTPLTTPTSRMTIVIPYRDREEHLKLFIQHMHPYLQAKGLEYIIVVVELEPDVIFKKGLLMNVGFIEMSKVTDIPCYGFHDVDMLPLNTHINYDCDPVYASHPARYIKQYQFKPFIYGPYSGGFLVFHKELFQRINGFSNLYWGWGGEDDDVRSRLHSLGVDIEEPTDDKLRYMSWNHERQELFKNRNEFVRQAVQRMDVEGLNSAEYHVMKIEKKQLYTRILVSANQTDGSYNGLKPEHGPKNWD